MINVKRILTITNNHLKPAISLLISLATYLVYSVFGRISYSIIDDYCISDIASDYKYDKIGEYLVCNNIVFGKIIRELYQLSHSINWFGFLIIGITVVSFAIVMYVFWNKTNSFISILPVIVMEIVVIINITFTIVAFIATIVAMLLLTYTFGDNNKNKIILATQCCIFMIMLVFGFMIREQSFIVAVALSLPLLIYIPNKKNKKLWIALLVSIVLVLGLGIYSNSLYHKGEWDKYSKSVKLRINLIDYKKIDFKKHKSDIEKIGFSENDIECFYAWNFSDRKVFSDQKLKKLESIMPLYEKYNFDIVDILKQVMTKKTTWLLLMIGMVLALLSRKKERIFIIISIIETLGFFGILIVRQRCVERVFIPIFLIGLINILYFFLCQAKRKQLLMISIITTALLGVYAIYQGHNKYQEFCNTIKLDEVKDYVNKEKDKLFLADFTVNYNIRGFYRPLLRVDPPVNNLYSLGEWDTFSPRYYKIMKKNKVSNSEELLTSLAKDENIYFVETKLFGNNDKGLKYLKEYIREHLNKNIKDRVIRRLPKTNTKIHKISVKK